MKLLFFSKSQLILLKKLDRRILGTAIGKAPKDKLFREYIELELQLREFDRCRKLYEKFLEFTPQNCSTWIKYAELETILGDPDRARAIFELAITQSMLDMPEVLWKTFIDFEIDLQGQDFITQEIKKTPTLAGQDIAYAGQGMLFHRFNLFTKVNFCKLERMKFYTFIKNILFHGEFFRN